MKTALTGLSLVILPCLAAPLLAQTRPMIPTQVLARMNTLDAACKAAGGRSGNGRYVIAQDFTGDGVLDYLISEGDYDCIGRPGTFRANGQARIDIFVADRANNARKVFSDTLAAYRVLAGRPAKVQVARRGAACGTGSAPNVQCAAQLAWNGSSFANGVSVSGDQPGVAGARNDTPAPATAMSAGARPVATPKLAANAQTEFLTKCRADLIRRDRNAARWADEECKTSWQKIVLSGSAADVLLAVTPSAGEAKPALAVIKQKAAGVRWGATRSPNMATGRLGDLDVAIEGRGSPASVSFSWGKVGAEIPYDVIGAMRARGVTMTERSCEQVGVGAGTRIYAGTATGRAPFTVTIDQQTAPLGHMQSYYVITLGLDGRHPASGTTTGCDF